MKFLTLITMFSISSMAHAGVIYNCSPQDDDGDAFGETLVLSLKHSLVSGRSALTQIDILSDYLPTMTAKKSPASANTFSSPLDDNYSNSGYLEFVLDKNISALNARGTVTLQDDGLKVQYTCKRISQ